ncbi:MAG: hypothetical protein QOF03_59 [Alphaproteobacteria bacterium]|jgi:hypothetical protein|nr:hypothetical protein [Alphaproteobacteria bacterium]
MQNRYNRRRIASDRSRAVIADAVSHSRILFLLLGLLALAIQILVVQTHIHIPQAAGLPQTVSVTTLAKTLVSGASVQAADDKANAPRDRYPINEDPSNCPLCQEIAHSGQFVHSAAALAALPAFVSVHFIVFSEALPSLFAVSHSWRGRAPPRI